MRFYDVAVEDLQIVQGLYRTRLSSQLTGTAKILRLYRGFSVYPGKGRDNT